MKRFDQVFLFTLYAPIFPILLPLVGWWSSVSLVAENQVVYFALGGLALGIIIDLLFLKKVLAPGYDQKPMVLGAIYLFYIVGIFGMFMGIPLFAVLPGIAAAIFVARRAAVNGWDNTRFKKVLNRTSCFATAVLLVVCSASAALALRDPFTGGNISGMLGLGFAVTNGMIWGIVIVGGLGLVGLQYGMMQLLGYKIAPGLK
jgi:hypothetical protein